MRSEMRTGMMVRSLFLGGILAACAFGASATSSLPLTTAANTVNRATRLAGVSLDGSRVVYLRDSLGPNGTDVHLLDLNAKTDVRVRQRIFGAATGITALSAGISGNGRYLALGLKNTSTGAIVLLTYDTSLAAYSSAETVSVAPPQQITAMKVSPDGSTVVMTTSSPAELWVWRPALGSPLRYPTSVELARGGQVFTEDSAKFVFSRPAGMAGKRAIFEQDVATGAVRALTCNSLVEYRHPTYRWTVPPTVVAVASSAVPAPGFAALVGIPTSGPCGNPPVIASFPGSTIVDAAAATNGNLIVMSSNEGPSAGYDVQSVDANTGAVTNLTMASFTTPPVGAWPDREGDIAMFTHLISPTLTGMTAVNMWTPSVGSGSAAPPPAPPFDVAGYQCYSDTWTEGLSEHVGEVCDGAIRNTDMGPRTVLIWHSLRGAEGLDRSWGPFVMPLAAGSGMPIERRFDTTCVEAQAYEAQINVVRTDALMDDVWFAEWQGVTTCWCLAPLGCF